MLLIVGAPAAWAQDAAPNDDAQEETPAPEEQVTDEEIEELLGLDQDYTEIEEDDFDPTQEVRFEQSIPFPTDI
ncbi:MAG: hypothetical protein MJA32_14275 [Proteobacteria bacterium]|nr:hypothetical protein [Pseudomonadota bacterium]